MNQTDVHEQPMIAPDAFDLLRDRIFAAIDASASDALREVSAAAQASLRCFAPPADNRVTVYHVAAGCNGAAGNWPILVGHVTGGGGGGGASRINALAGAGSIFSGGASGNAKAGCWCERCDTTLNNGMRTRMSVCPQCGDKRCARAACHRNRCSRAAIAKATKP